MLVQTHIGIGSRSVGSSPISVLIEEPEVEVVPLTLSPGLTEGAPWMAWAMALFRIVNQSCISKELSACSRSTLKGEVTLNEKFRSVSFTSAG